MSNVKVHIQFPEDKIKEPVIYQIGHEYQGRHERPASRRS